MAQSVQSTPELHGADTTWVAIAAALIMGLSGVCLFIFAVKKDYFRDFEDAKYQVFWPDIDEEQSKNDGSHTPSKE